LKKIKRVHLFFILLCLAFANSLLLEALPQKVGDEKLPSLAPMLEKVTPAVVNIATEGRVQVRQNPLFADSFFRRFFNIPNQPV